jgi:Xaa-Pro aminopeptidase
MALDVASIQQALQRAGLDGWLLYDFHGSNPIAARLAGLANGTKMTTRRWYYLVPAHGTPRALVHAIERYNLDHLPGERHIYAGRLQLDEGLRTLLDGMRRVAMEYSPRCDIPYLSRVDAGTLEVVRDFGVEVVPSGNLVQQFEAIWSADAIASHRAASERLYRIKDRAFSAITERVAGAGATEYDIQQLMAGWFVEEGLVTDASPVVAAQENAGNPHYLPNAAQHRAIGKDELVLLDLWGKLQGSGTVFADITWVGYTGAQVPDTMARAFAAARDARDAAAQLVQARVAAGEELRGFEVDRAARAVLEGAGFGAAILHRTGHSLGVDVHGSGVHMDDYETHDDRLLLPGTGFTIEPGLYFADFGVRTEINMVVERHQATVTGPAQREIVRLI